MSDVVGTRPQSVEPAVIQPECQPDAKNLASDSSDQPLSPREPTPMEHSSLPAAQEGQDLSHTDKEEQPHPVQPSADENDEETLVNNVQDVPVSLAVIGGRPSATLLATEELPPLNRYPLRGQLAATPAKSTSLSDSDLNRPLTRSGLVFGREHGEVPRSIHNFCMREHQGNLGTLPHPSTVPLATRKSLRHPVRLPTTMIGTPTDGAAAPSESNTELNNEPEHVTDVTTATTLPKNTFTPAEVMQYLSPIYYKAKQADSNMPSHSVGSYIEHTAFPDLLHPPASSTPPAWAASIDEAMLDSTRSSRAPSARSQWSRRQTSASTTTQQQRKAKADSLFPPSTPLERTVSLVHTPSADIADQQGLNLDDDQGRATSASIATLGLLPSKRKDLRTQTIEYEGAMARSLQLETSDEGKDGKDINRSSLKI